jgi:hypothetical protein
MEDKRREHKILMGYPDVERPLGIKNICGQTMV